MLLYCSIVLRIQRALWSSGIVVVFGGQPFADALFERLHLRVSVESVYGDDRRC